jgi:DNA-binding NarL/FixJ family response regulator
MERSHARVLLIDDHQLVRDALHRLLTDVFGIGTVIEADSLAGGLAHIIAGPAIDMLLVDLNLPDTNGPASLAALVDMLPDARIAVISSSTDPEDVLGCLALGVDGYLPKELSTAELVQALENILEGGSYVPRNLTRRGPATAQKSTYKLAEIPNLTPRQAEVLDQLRLGKTSKEIARTLDMAEGTVKIHLAAIYRVMGVRTRAEVIAKLLAGTNIG